LDRGFDARTRAEAWAIERMIENHFTWTLVYARWILPANFEKGPARLFDNAPEGIRAQLRQDVRARVAEALQAVGIGRHSGTEIVELGDRSLSALSTLLGDKAYLMGDAPCGVDATALGALAGATTPFFDSALRQRAETYSKLTAYVDRMKRQYYPDHPW
jgi:glutathione S-transferase